MIDIEKLADECGAYIASEAQGETPFMVRGEMIFDSESLYKFAEAYAAKVLEDKEREIAAAHKQIELDDGYMLEFKAHINDLREALEEIHSDSFVDSWQCKLAEQALSKTPAQSLQAFENEVIEKCANVVNRKELFVIANEIRALKGKQDGT